MTIWRTRFFWRTGSAFSIRLRGGWLGVDCAIPALYWAPFRIGPNPKGLRVLWTTRAMREKLAAEV